MALNIADLFEHAVDAVPEKPAVQVEERVITFAELEAEANRLAHYLQSQGIKPGDHVGLYAKNSIEHVIALIAILKVRAVSINVNFRYVAGQSDARDFGERSPDDIHIIYTGGTTGFPKGVMWRHEDSWRVLGGGIDFMTAEPLGEYDG